MDVNAKIGTDSKQPPQQAWRLLAWWSTSLCSPQADFDAAGHGGVAVFLIKPPEQYIYAKVGNRFVSYGTVILTFILRLFSLHLPLRTTVPVC